LQGTQPLNEKGSTSLVTTAPVATTASSLNVQPDKTITLGLNQALLPIVIFLLFGLFVPKYGNYIRAAQSRAIHHD
jgi:hypothetical protein